jgi:murein DD-endopeptidase MepM/ murein hydrolase activator NlpD
MACSPLVNYPLERLPKIVSDPYSHPPPGSDARHEGVDFAFNHLAGISIPIEGAGIQSVLAGRVAAALQNSFPYGNFVIIETHSQALSPGLVERLGIAPDQSIYVLYAHMQDNLAVQLGQQVSACQRLGRVGKSGNTAVAHLHLETRLGPNGASFTEMAAFVGTITPLQRSNYKLWRTSGVFNHFDPMILLTYLPE